MLGKPDWFQRRKYGGWGITPKTWQGWIYIIIMILPFIIFQSLSVWDNDTRFIVTLFWVAILVIDVIDIMIHLKRDEQEKIHEAFAERNAAWFMSIILALGLVYYMIVNGLNHKMYVEPFIAIALFGGVIIKSITNYVLSKKN